MMLRKAMTTINAIRHGTGAQPFRREAIFGFESMPREPEHVLVSKQKLIVVVRVVIVEPSNQLQVVKNLRLSTIN